MRQLVRGVLLTIAVLTPVGSAEARNNYGAIAYSRSTGAYGHSYDYPTRNGAEARALAECRERAADCQLPLWFRNACGALAVGQGGGWGTGWGTNRKNAERIAIKGCRKHTSNCSILDWVCTTR